MNIAVLVLIAAAAIERVSSARILGFFVVPSISHCYVYRRLMLELSRRGHQVTIAIPSPYGISTPNYTEIDLGFSYDLFRNRYNFFKPTIPEALIFDFLEFHVDILDRQLSYEPVRQLIQNGRFDLVIVEKIIFPAASALAHHFKCPHIGVSSLETTPANHYVIGNPYNPSYHSDIFLEYDDKKDFLSRVRSTLLYIFWLATYYWYLIPRHNAVAKKHLGPNTPNVLDIEKNVSMVFTYTDLAWSVPVPTVPGYVRIGGGRPLHMPDLKPLPQDIQDFMDGAENGVVYFSLGSNVKSEAMPESKRRIFMEAFRRIKQKVLWKWEADVLPQKPDNVKIGKWFPQTDILAHPNLRLFITQGGLQSVSEATYNKVPMIVIPFFADQELNAKKLVSEGVAIRVDYEDLQLETFLSALDTVLNDNRYRERIVAFSELTQDQPENPLDRAVWWTEYVIRHKGAKHLRSAAVDMPWYQYFLLDVIAFLIAAFLMFIYALYVVAKLIRRVIFGRSKSKKD